MTSFGLQFFGRHVVGRQEQGIIKKEVDSQSLARGLIALRDGLYSSLSLLGDVSRARKSWVDITGLIMKEILIPP